ncbi:MAG: helix-hairpin-helix domain-containing protein [Candidatus Pacearchaeota archaeon]
MREVLRFSFLFTFLLIILLSTTKAGCEKGQININNATREDLLRIKYIGPVLSERIIQERPFESIDDLIRVKGIGTKILDKIKKDGIACVDYYRGDSWMNSSSNKGISMEEKAKEEREDTFEERMLEKENEKNIIITPLSIKEENRSYTSTPLNFEKEDNKSIMHHDNKNYYDNLPLYGLTIFLIIILFLLSLRYKKLKKNKRTWLE